MTATTHIAAAPYGAATPRPLTGLRARWDAFALKHSRRVQLATFQQLHDGLPLDDPDRHAMEAPALEDAFAHLAIDYPGEVAHAAMRPADHAQQLLAACDAWFRDVHGPEHRWSPRTVAAYDRLMADVRACFPSGTS
ncbi:hypothetical protein ABZ468_25705 [Streptomyces sp. NPDC005708]|uniref:hypothetical protein n=1 Tax=Streptomyces sp. NPDC005708 TaxID=3154564 RepID=UPI003410AF49